jgi:hypothetical protein
LVKLPSFSTWLAAGRKKTSVGISSGRVSPASISGESCQKAAVSSSVKSRTTSQSSDASALRWSVELADPTTGFCPTAKSPFVFPSIIRIVVA